MSSQQLRRPEDRQSNTETQPNDEDDLDEQFGNISLFDSLTSQATKLRILSEMVQRHKEMPNLRVQLNSILNATEHNEIDLSKTKELLDKRELNARDIEAILNDIKKARRTLAKKIVQEGRKCKISLTYAQFVNLARAWKLIIKSKMVKSKSKKLIANIESNIEKTSIVCGETQKLIAQYNSCKDTALQNSILTQLELKCTKIRDGYETCSDLISSAEFQDMKLDISLKALNLYFSEIEQREAAKLSVEPLKKPKLWIKTAIKVWTGEPLMIAWGVGEVAAYGIATGASAGTSKVAETTRGSMKKLEDRIKNLEATLREIDVIKKDCEEFLKNSDQP